MLGSAAEILSRVLGLNQVNDEDYLSVETYNSQKGVVVEYSSSQTDTVLVSPSSGNKLIVTGFSISSNSNVGEVYLEFDGGSLIGKLYSSADTRLSAGKFTITGGEGVDILVQGGGVSFIVMLNYIEVEA